MTDRTEPPEHRTISLDDEAQPSPFFARECTTPSSESMLQPLGPPPDLPAAPPSMPGNAGSPAESPAGSPPPVDLPDVEFDGAPPPPPRRTRKMPVRPERDPTLPPRRLRDRIWLPGRAAVLVVLAVAVGVTVVRNWNRELAVTPEHRALVVTAERLATFLEEEVWVVDFGEGFEVQPAAESIEARRRLGGALNVVYRYAGRGIAQPTLEVEAGVHRSAAAARTVYRAHEIEAVVDRGGVGEGIVERVELDRDCRWGDRSSAALVLRDSTPVGHDFLARSGRTTLRVKLRGVAFQDGLELRQLLAPTLDALAAQE